MERTSLIQPYYFSLRIFSIYRIGISFGLMLTLRWIAIVPLTGLLVGLGLAQTTIHFPKGARRMAIKGKLSQSHFSDIYKLRGFKGERLKIQLLSKGGVSAIYHITFPDGETFGTKGYDAFPGVLTKNGMYKIEVDVNSMASNGTHGTYTLILSR